MKTKSTNKKMASSKPKLTKKAKVVNHLTNGKTLTVKQASTLYGVKNLRATISDIKSKVFNIKTTFNKTGQVSYAKS